MSSVLGMKCIFLWTRQLEILRFEGGKLPLSHLSLDKAGLFSELQFTVKYSSHILNPYRHFTSIILGFSGKLNSHQYSHNPDEETEAQRGKVRLR